MINLRNFSKEDRKHIAANWCKYITSDSRLINSINECISNTTDYRLLPKDDIQKKYNRMNIIVEQSDSITCLFQHFNNTKFAMLNFASYKNPGGMFIEGSSAQEEALCHHSILYPVLLSFKKSFYEPHLKLLNRGLYKTHLLYSKDILFLNTSLDNNLVHSYNVSEVNCDVITIAAPNKGTFLKYFSNYSDKDDDEINNTLNERIDTLLYYANLNNVENIILGAFGCGVFKNNPYEVASVFKNLLLTKYYGCFNNVYFPIPFSKYDNNYTAFKSILR